MADILKVIPFADCIPMYALGSHSKLREYATRSRVTHQVPSFDSVQLKLLETKLHQKPPCLRAVTVVPVLYTDPVADFCLRMGRHDSQTNRTNKLVGRS